MRKSSSSIFQNNERLDVAVNGDTIPHMMGGRRATVDKMPKSEVRYLHDVTIERLTHYNVSDLVVKVNAAGVVHEVIKNDGIDTARLINTTPKDFMVSPDAAARAVRFIADTLETGVNHYMTAMCVNLIDPADGPILRNFIAVKDSETKDKMKNAVVIYSKRLP